MSTLHGKTNKHPGITKITQECGAKYYFPGLARKIRAWVTSCPDCVANKRIDTRQIRPKMISNTEFTMGPEDCLEVDILRNLPSSNGYQHIITMMDVFLRYLFAYPLERTHASLKTSLKISTGERRSIWRKYVQIAVMNYNTSYHESLGCEPTTVFHGRIPYNILDIRLGLKPKKIATKN